MSERIEARGDIGQIIDGNVNEAPRQNNVVNFNLGSDKGPLPTLTDLQRKRIADLVRELCSITQEDTLDVYRVILTEFGADRMRDIPREMYRDIVAQLECWIAENTNRLEEELELPVGTTGTAAADVPQATSSVSNHCVSCVEEDISYARLQSLSHGQWALAVVFAAMFALMLFKTLSSVKSVNSGEHHCWYESKSYSAGSSMKFSGAMHECGFDPKTQAMSWMRQQHTGADD